MNKKNITILVILLLVVLYLAYFFINSSTNIEDNNDLSGTESSDEGYEAVESTDEIIGEIDDSLNYFE